ncbi:FmdB family zinc ribbon protein [Micrococcus luteus]|uniref:FmdB family zinc ribbon protein n=1 Tax=Micrococcus luteus TaxID=1270 RepID=UPI00387931C8
MPTYAYRCKDCGHAFDAVQAFTDDALTECPACGGVLRKQYGSVGVSFKGSGFYRTDSRSGTGSAGGSTSDSAAGSSTSSTSASAAAD